MRGAVAQHSPSLMKPILREAVLAVVFMGIYLSKHAECISVDRRPNLGHSR